MLTSNFNPEICEEASNRQDAVLQRRLRSRPISAILDISMPIVSGFGAAKEIQRLMPQVPILFLAMHGGEQFLLKEMGEKLNMAGQAFDISPPSDIPAFAVYGLVAVADNNQR